MLCTIYFFFHENKYKYVYSGHRYVYPNLFILFLKSGDITQSTEELISNVEYEVKRAAACANSSLHCYTKYEFYILSTLNLNGVGK